MKTGDRHATKEQHLYQNAGHHALRYPRDFFDINDDLFLNRRANITESGRPECLG